MPFAPPKPCKAPRCPNLTYTRYCTAHQQLEVEQRRQSEARRENSYRRGYTRSWEKASRAHRKEHPLCVECLKEGRVTAATCTDHVIPHKGDMTLFWNPDNWQSLCDAHHSAKTAREDGGFGNAIGKR